MTTLQWYTLVITVLHLWGLLIRMNSSESEASKTAALISTFTVMPIYGRVLGIW